MKKHILYLVFIFMIFSFGYASAQIVAFENPEADLQRARIGLVDEFMKRFNGDEIHPETNPSDSDSLNKNFIWLFDYEQFISHDKNVQDSIRAEALNLMEIVKNDSIKINYSDSTWVAIAHCKGTVMGKPEKFDIFLTVQSRGEDMYKWVINAVDGKCFNIEPHNTNDNLIISPDAHETKFITLNRISKEQPHNIRLFLSKNIDYDQTSVFTYLVYTGKLKIDFVERLEFVFLQVPGYAFHIQYFDRLSYNSGWLISHFYRLSDLDKAAFRKMINQNGLEEDYSYESIESIESDNLSSDSITINIPETVPVNNVLTQRINERLKALKDYISFISSDKNDKSTKRYYAQKLIKLFSPEAKAITKDSLTGETKVTDIKKFVDGIVNKKLTNIVIQAVTTAIIKKSDSDNEKSEILGMGVVPLSIIESDEALNVIYNKMLPYHVEDTEDGVEYIFDFGDIYISVK